MDQLPEPKFSNDSTWPRIMHGADELLKQSNTKYYKAFTLLASLSSYRYLREIWYYKRNHLSASVIVPLFVLSSHFLAEFYAYDPYVNAALTNNQREREYINEYKNLYKQAKSKNLDIPDYLIY